MLPIQKWKGRVHTFKVWQVIFLHQNQISHFHTTNKQKSTYFLLFSYGWKMGVDIILSLTFKQKELNLCMMANAISYNVMPYLPKDLELIAFKLIDFD